MRCFVAEQLEQVCEEDQGVHPAVRRHLSLLHRSVQMHRGGSGKRVSGKQNIILNNLKNVLFYFYS
jgi:hypothetical protein